MCFNEHPQYVARVSAPCLRQQPGSAEAAGKQCDHLFQSKTSSVIRQESRILGVR